MTDPSGWTVVFNTISHAVLIVMVGYLLWHQRSEQARTDLLEREVGYVKGRINGGADRRQS